MRTLSIEKKNILTYIICTVSSNIPVCTITFIFIDQIYTSPIVLTWLRCTLVYIWNNEYVKTDIYQRKLNTKIAKTLFFKYIKPEKNGCW